MAGLIASQGLGVYNTTKYAVVGLSETLQKDLRAPSHRRVRALSDGRAHEHPPERAQSAGPPREPARARAASEVDLIGRYLAPEHVADRVLRAIRANRLYVITHEEGLDPLRRRFQRMEKAIEESR